MTGLPKLHVAVLMGGWAKERPVSLMSGEGVAAALEGRGHRVTRIDMDRDVAARIAEAAPDVVFNALHGVPGEDGTVQGMLDLMGIPYTHSGLATSVIAIDKQLTKNALVPHGIPMPEETATINVVQPKGMVVLTGDDFLYSTIVSASRMGNETVDFDLITTEKGRIQSEDLEKLQEYSEVLILGNETGQTSSIRQRLGLCFKQSALLQLAFVLLINTRT